MFNKVSDTTQNFCVCTFLINALKDADSKTRPNGGSVNFDDDKQFKIILECLNASKSFLSFFSE